MWQRLGPWAGPAVFTLKERAKLVFCLQKSLHVYSISPGDDPIQEKLNILHYKKQ